MHGVLEVKAYDVFIGEIVRTYARQHALTEGKPDSAKIRPLMFDMNSRNANIGELRSLSRCTTARVGVGFTKGFRNHRNTQVSRELATQGCQSWFSWFE